MAKKRSPEETLSALETLETDLSKAATRNAGLLEVLETLEGHASGDTKDTAESSTHGTGAGTAASMLKGLRARLNAAHGPNAAVRRDLAEVKNMLKSQFLDTQHSKQRYDLLHQELQAERRELNMERRKLEVEQRQVEETHRKWKGRLEESKRHVEQQQEKLAALSERLAGQTSDLVAQRSLVALTAHGSDMERESSAAPANTMALQSVSEAALVAEAEQLRQQLRALMVRNVNAENDRLRMELAQRQKEEQLSILDQTNQKLKSEATRSRQEVLKATKQFEKRTTEANRRLTDMAMELAKTQESARRFQELLAAERRKQHGLQRALEDELQKSGHQRTSGLTEDQGVALASAQQAYIQTLSDALGKQTQTSGTSHIRVEDVVRRNESLLLEVAKLKADVKRLQGENTTMLQQTKLANADAKHMRMYVSTCMADRTELQKRLEKADREHRRLENSLTHQASDWVRSKRAGKQTEQHRKWDHLTHVPEVNFFKYNRSHIQSPPPPPPH
ncbi:serologically defined colon cancer antigen 8-like [Sycon ciliatum]|uniref:serologically defined colon cancer antigen 8-like n=1 Tax=Sycon ciliatum TaxID=27933 RepID=UPI0020AA8DA4|eukprot:scpid59973/ scgid5717/ 